MQKVVILVIDDEDAIRKLLDRVLGDQKYRIITAANFSEGLEFTAQQWPDIILLDVNLESQPDGLKVCRQLRTQHNSDHYAYCAIRQTNEISDTKRGHG